MSVSWRDGECSGWNGTRGVRRYDYLSPAMRDTHHERVIALLLRFELKVNTHILKITVPLTSLEIRRLSCIILESGMLPSTVHNLFRHYLPEAVAVDLPMGWCLVSQHAA